ncbi:replication endonuclease [Aggregatibacter kilianii]|uniref:replication endonuclease n=1 Tax=Aggregatibacter kilianii TaxID=2025884 RepID=UPI001EF873AB|nr:replication endonuclease [Aggregatibacter kilianii]
MNQAILKQESAPEAAPVIAQSAVKKYRAFADSDRKTELQLELFDTVPNSYSYVEKVIAQLPRERQREHFRKLYLKQYHSIKDDGSIAFQAGNVQQRAANLWLRETLNIRLKKVFSRYKINVSFLHAFKSSPNWLLDLKTEIAQQQRFVTVPTRAEHAGNHLTQKTTALFDKYGKKQAQDANFPFYLLTEAKLKSMAYELAYAFQLKQQDFIEVYAKDGKQYDKVQSDSIIMKLYKQCGLACEAIGFEIPHWARYCEDKKIKMERIDVALCKVADEKYWFYTMKTTQKRIIEHIAIACGEVRKQANSYVSYQGFINWQNQIKKNYDYLKAMIVENVDNPEEQAELFDMFLKSSSNPALRRQEMMLRLRGLEEWAEENGNEALFLTLTAPSSFHATHSHGENNKKWQGNSPRETQAYLNTVWQQYRALLAKRDIKMYGMRVAEPHHDATPHWHLLVYVKSEHKAEAIRLFKIKALEIDGDEQGAKKHRCKVEECDKSKGSATAYIAKYISKNIDGFALKDEKSDENPNLSLRDNAKRVRAWASLWGIRQFQFYGGASVSVWRELRRLVAGQCDDELIEKARICADTPCFASYLQIQGGALASRKDQAIKLDYEQTKENRFGEMQKKIKGVKNVISFKSVISRIKKWTIKKRPTERGEANKKAGIARLGLVSVTVTAEKRAELTKKIKSLLEPTHFRPQPEQIDYLINNNKLVLDRIRSIEIINDEPIMTIKREPLILDQIGEPSHLSNLRNLSIS